MSRERTHDAAILLPTLKLPVFTGLFCSLSSKLAPQALLVSQHPPSCFKSLTSPFSASFWNPMFAEQIATREQYSRTSCATLLYSVVYIILWLHYRIQRAYIALLTFCKRSRTTLLNQQVSHQKPLRLQNHLAISGAISLHIDHLVQLLAFLVDAGTNHITLYDHLRPINPTHLTNIMCQHDLHSFRISYIGQHESHTHFSTSQPTVTRHQCYLTEEKPLDLPKLQLTIVNPGTGRAAIARSARMLAEHQSIHNPNVTPEQVMEWLDKDEAACMLPSEPDTLIVFPSPGCRSVPILNEFPVWQLRLTQIRFSARPITDTSVEDFSEMVSSAASAPKRFGR